MEADGEIESILDNERVAAYRIKNIDERESRHGGALIELHRVARHPIAEINAPWQRGRRPVGEVVEAGEEAADAADRDADREWERKARAGAPGDARAALVELDRNDSAYERPFDRARKPGLLREPEIGAAEGEGADPGSDYEGGEIGKVMRTRGRKAYAGAACKPDVRKPRRRPGQNIEADMKQRARHRSPRTSLGGVPMKRNGCASAHRYSQGIKSACRCRARRLMARSSVRRRPRF